MPQRQRAHFINSLSGFKSANLIATQDLCGNTNLAIFSSVVHFGASPPLVGLIMRPNNGNRHTLDNILNKSLFTINQVSVGHYQQAHQTSAAYTKNECEFKSVGLNKEYLEGIDVPFVKESQLRYAVQLKDVLPITHNNTQLILGEIIHVCCNSNAIKADGYIDIESLETVTVSGLDSYHITQRLSRLAYAKPNQKCDVLSDVI